MSLLRRMRYRYDSTDGNAVELLAGAETFYPRILEDIAAAQHEVLLGTYLWEPDEVGQRFLEAACDAARRGLTVRVLLDGIGSHRLESEHLEALRSAGAQAVIHHALRFPLFDSRLFRRYHRKLILIDGQIAYTGGAGFADSWATPPPTQWWDLMVRVRGPVLVPLRMLFSGDWKRTTRNRMSPLQAPPPEPVGDARIHPLITFYSRRELMRRLLQAVSVAEHRVHIANAYFIPGFRLRRALRKAASRGVDVRLVLPGPRTDHFAVWTAGRRHYHRLLKKGVRIYEFQRSMLHSKFAVVDDRWGYVGSSNLDSWSGRFNHELDLGITTPGPLEELDQQFEDDVRATREITLNQWQARPLSLKLLETFFGWFDPLL